MLKNSQVVILSGEADAHRRIPMVSFEAGVRGRLLWSDKSPDEIKECRKECSGPSTSPYDSQANCMAPLRMTMLSQTFPSTSQTIAYISYKELIFARNSPFDFVLLNLSISSSIASTGDSGFSTLRSTQIRVRSSFGISNSSLRVPER